MGKLQSLLTAAYKLLGLTGTPDGTPADDTSHGIPEGGQVRPSSGVSQTSLVIEPSRRRFLKQALGAAGIATLGASGLVDAEKLLWAPGEKLISLPPAVLLPAMTRAELDELGRSLGHSHGVDYSSRFVDEKTGMTMRLVRAYDIMQDRFIRRYDMLFGFDLPRNYKIGDTLHIRKPPRYPLLPDEQSVDMLPVTNTDIGLTSVKTYMAAVDRLEKRGILMLDRSEEFGEQEHPFNSGETDVEEWDDREWEDSE